MDTTLLNLDRINFASVKNRIEYPDFLDIQIKSFKSFFQLDTKSEHRKNEGLFKTFIETFPISDTRNNFILEFIDYFIDPPRYSIQECIQRGLTYSISLKARLKLYCTDPEHEDFETVCQDVYLGYCPYMTPAGTFIFNGIERVIVSQLHRSPGVFFGQSYHANGTKLYSARIIPFKGSWIEFATDINNVMYAYIDRKKKLPMTTLLRAIGYETDADILKIFNLTDEVKATKEVLNNCIGRTLSARILNTISEEFVNKDTGEIISIEKNNIILDRDIILNAENIEIILKHKIKYIFLHKEINNKIDYSIINNTLQKDPTNSEKEAVDYIYKQIRGTEPPDEETARNIIDKLFFSDTRYNLGVVGRYRLNKRLGLNIDANHQVLTKEDIISIIEYLNELYNSKKEIDDIDHLSNRRVKTVGEQLFTQFSIGLARMSRTIRERMNVRDNEVFTPVDLINSKTLSSVINSFFGTNQLSQFMDQTNPLAEITHKRRLSALGPGGLSRERAGFEVRDVNYSHYGRLCPIETPEGPNIGLISSMCVFAKINDMGFIETPYYVVDKKYNRVEFNKRPVYLSAEEEEGKVIAQANSVLNNDTNFDDTRIVARKDGDLPVVHLKNVDYVDVMPNQIASISASLIPFLEHDDANRALMGSNMMRQAVPLLKPKAPIVGTGLERRVAKDSRILINAEHDGVVIYVDADKITIKYEIDDALDLISFDSNIQTYNLVKFQKTNQNTCISLKPIVKKGMRVVKGQVLCEGYATENGELSLGTNCRVAFMPFKGYNFEDAIVVSERVVREDFFTSIHIEEYSLDVRDTKLGIEEFTNDIPNVSEEATKELDEDGVIRIGAKVKPGDILIGKITPKGESDPTPEEKLLRAIFGEKAGNIKDASLRAEPSLFGVVIDKKIFYRNVRDRKSDDNLDINKLNNKYKNLFIDLHNKLIYKLFKVLNGRIIVEDIFNNDVKIFSKNNIFSQEVLSSIKDYSVINNFTWTHDNIINNIIKELFHGYKIKYNDLQVLHKKDKFSITVGDELPVGVIKVAKVYIAKKRKLKVGDKMAGRHGNKGVVARIVRDEDMPFLEDGTQVDIVLNPLGVPSRMNIGQIYETVLGWAGYNLNCKFSTPIFDGASMKDINYYTDKANIPKYGSTYLYDGATGERFDQPVTVGVIYMLKLGHMVDDKMHSRSIGPYSLITQQPLGGKAQFGGQRFGEMEVWALEAFGASNILREMMTIKSDDVIGRAKAFEAIVKGEALPNPGIPESFNVLRNELLGLGISLNLEE